MGKSLTRPVSASFLAARLELSLAGPDLLVQRVCPLGSLEPDALTYAKKGVALAAPGPLLVIGSAELAGGVISVLASDRPRLAFAKALRLLDEEIGFEKSGAPPKIHPTAQVGRNVVLGNGVEIGEGARIGHNVVVGHDVKIGRFSVIKSGAIIGEDGFGFERDLDGTPLRMLHLGSVVIGDHVEIGSLTTVCRGTLGDTVIEDFAKIDDHVHVAHNCHVKKNALVIACAELSGGAVVGNGAWVAPNASVLEKVVIGDRATVGLGAVVLREVAADQTVVGNPARPLTRTGG
jgi:UDP-3-O-[3-hydroxymyristoyl] glucosamine N-acyltransferase